jgi:hypothetical protein
MPPDERLSADYVAGTLWGQTVQEQAQNGVWKGEGSAPSWVVGEGHVPQVPMIYQGGFTGAWWCATRWKERPDGGFEALEKFDVTGQIEEILAAQAFALREDGP